MNYYLITILSFSLMATACSRPEQSTEKAETEVSEAEITETATSAEIDVSSIELTDLEGNAITWESLQGKKVFLNFWATWCKPCIVEMPSMQQASEQLGEDYVFLAASYEELDKIKTFAGQRDFSFQFVHTKTPLENLNIYSIPTTFLINEEGELVETVIGSRPWNQSETINHLKNL